MSEIFEADSSLYLVAITNSNERKREQLGIHGELEATVSVCPRKPFTRLVCEVDEFHVLRVISDDAVRSAGSRDTLAGRLDTRNPGIANGDCTPASKSGNLASIVIDQRDRVSALWELSCVNL